MTIPPIPIGAKPSFPAPGMLIAPKNTLSQPSEESSQGNIVMALLGRLERLETDLDAEKERRRALEIQVASLQGESAVASSCTEDAKAKAASLERRNAGLNEKLQESPKKILKAKQQVEAAQAVAEKAFERQRNAGKDAFDLSLVTGTGLGVIKAVTSGNPLFAVAGIAAGTIFGAILNEVVAPPPKPTINSLFVSTWKPQKIII